MSALNHIRVHEYLYVLMFVCLCVQIYMQKAQVVCVLRNTSGLVKATAGPS